MTKRAWGTVWRLSFDGRPEKARPLTEDELWDVEFELDAWHEAHADVMSPELWFKLQKHLFDWPRLQLAWNQEKIRQMRWCIVHWALKRGMPLKRVFKYAEDSLRGTPAQAGHEMMRKDYYEIEKRRRG